MKLSFADCALDLDRQVLLRDGQTVELEPQVFRLLAHFVIHSGELVSREELCKAVWDGRIVSDSAISTRINAVRRAIGDDDRSNRQHLKSTQH